MSRVNALFVLLPALIAGCAVEPDSVEVAEAWEDASAERVPGGASTYYTVTPDYRDCLYPACGGFFVKRVNRPQTRCADGTLADSCYVVKLGTAGLFARPADQDAYYGAVYEGRALLRGNLAETDVEGQLYGVLRVNEAWEGMAPAPAVPGRFVRATFNDTVCITDPCPSIDEQLLNLGDLTAISQVDWNGLGLDRGQSAVAYAGLSTVDGTIVAGTRFTDTGTGGSFPARRARQVYRLVAAE